MAFFLVPSVVHEWVGVTDFLLASLDRGTSLNMCGRRHLAVGQLIGVTGFLLVSLDRGTNIDRGL